MTSPEREREETPPANPVSDQNNEADEQTPSKEEDNDKTAIAEVAAGDADVTPESSKRVVEVPEIGLEFDTEAEAYAFYQYYAWKNGFSVRREYGNKCKKTGEITSRKFTCSREGFKTHDKRVNHTKPTQPDTRTGCKAFMIIRRKKTNNKLEVVQFNREHNHPLLTCANPLQKKIVDTDPNENLSNSNRNVNNNNNNIPHAIMAAEPEPAGELATTAWQIQKSQLSHMRNSAMRFGEICSISDYFQARSLEDPLFFHAVQFDSEERASNVFWADAKMIMDYGHFGDMVAFDIASRNLGDGYRPFVSFVGFNHYTEMVLFGAGFLYDQSVESLVWLFETFIQAMSNKKPRTIYTHQDPEISKAISLAMPQPDTYHALCTWHIKETAKKQHAHLFRGGCDFKKDFKACMNDFDDEVEFLTAWNSMIDKYNLRHSDNIWLQQLFEEKEKWARPWVKWVFSCGMKNTQLNDGLNNELKEFLKMEMGAVDFFRRFEAVLNNRRYKELEGEFSARLKLPYFKIKAPILTQVNQIYTYTIFEAFQLEYEEFQSCYIVNRDESGHMREYVVSVLGKNGQYKVFGTPSEQAVDCSCQKFHTHGFLCSHALKILDAMDVKQLPERYILRRWSKFARDIDPHDLGPPRVIQQDTTLEVSSRYKHLCPKYIKLVNRASECEESFQLLDKYYVELNAKVQEILSKQTTIDATHTDNTNMSISLSGLGPDLDRLEIPGSRSRKRKAPKVVKPQYRSAIEKNLHKKRKSPPEQQQNPTAGYGVLDPSTPTGSILFQGMDVPATVPQVAAHAQAYKQYKGIDLSNPLGPMGYDGMHAGLNASFAAPVLRENMAFTSYHHAQGSHNQYRNDREQ
ncbi:hypothetical protein LUZ60_004180 [Juncus effusus]|nr:hypothetical protein LUZ60_004180 [Juncus effusus]